MNTRLKKTLLNPRVIISLVFIVLAIVAINPDLTPEGAAIRSVTLNSSANLAGITSPTATAPPRSREVVLAMNTKPIKDASDYNAFVAALQLNQTVTVRTNKNTYLLRTKPLTEIIILNETETKIIAERNLVTNETRNRTIVVNKTLDRIIGVEDIGLKVYDAPTTNIRKGLDLQGGTRVLLTPESKVSADDMDLILSNMKERLNVFGLSDVVIREAGDLSGNQYILVEIAGANEEEVKELLARQGKFEAKIGEAVVFRGGHKDITYICRTADCSGIDPQAGCGPSGSGWACQFRFAITLSPEAAEQQASLTKNLNVITENNQQYLSEQLLLYLDDVQVDQLNIGADLRGRAVTDIQISGSGTGATQQEAITNSLTNMKRLQTILTTGSLPVKLKVVKTDVISPSLGEEFVRNSILIGAIAMIGVVVVVFLRYWSLKVALPMILTMLTEVIGLFGVAALIGWNIDIAAIAGIIVAIGTGVDAQIVIADEALRGEKQTVDWKRRFKNAFFIIFAAYFTGLVAMVPLLFAGAGLVKGFAITTILGISIGVFIARPAYAKIVEILIKD